MLKPLFSHSPFPSWEMQQIGKCSAFQFVQSMEIDPNGWMWMPDNGYVGNTRSPLCPPKIIVFDTNQDKVIKVILSIYNIQLISHVKTPAIFL